jgi:cytochrome P450
MAFRMMVQARFAPKSMQRLQEPLKGFIADLIDEMAAGGAREADFNQALALPLPVKTTQHLLGGHDVDYRELAHLADRSMYYSRYGGEPEMIASMRARIAEVFDKWIDDREALLRKAAIDAPDRSHIGSILPDDVTSDLLVGRWEGRRLTRAELHKMLIVMLVGGIETTNHLIGNCVWRLLEDRSRWEAVMADQDRLIPVAIEESLRFDPPGLGLWRTTLREIELQGRMIPAHAKVQMAYAAANRDPRVFPDPDSFRLDRPMAEMRRHLSFGAGPHTCVGQYLARLEAQLTLKALFERLPSLRLAGETERVENFSFWGRRRLPVVW